MKLEPIINFMHYVQYRVQMSDICDSVSFGANDEAGRLEIVFHCSEKLGKQGGLVFKNHVAREFSYESFFKDDFDYEESANTIVDSVEKLFIGEVD